MGKLKGDLDSAAFAIGAGCTHTFDRDGELVVFANDSADGFGNNRGSVSLEAVAGGVAPAPPDYGGGVISVWHATVDAFNRTAGIPVMVAFVLGVSLILVGMPQGRDLVRGVGEDRFSTQQVAFALGLLFFGVQAWSWSRIVIVSNYGENRDHWRPRWLLEWGPRLLSFVPFFAAAIALFADPAKNVVFVGVLLGLGVVFLIFLIMRRRIVAWLTGEATAPPGIQSSWTVIGLAGAMGGTIVAVLWPSGIGVALGAPAIVFFGLGFIIPVTTIAAQLGTSLRIPVVGALLLWAVLIGAFVDNHGVGRRAFIGETTAPIGRPTLEQAYATWAAKQAGGAQAKKTMVLIAVQGGASRAGYWTAVALAELRKSAAARTVDGRPAPVDFDSHVFAISSVSGGSVGSVGYAAMLKVAPNDPDFRNHLLSFAGRDALGPAVTGMLYSDLLYRFLPLPFLPDRAEMLDRSWEEAWDAREASGAAAGAGTIRGPFLALATKEGEPWQPILIVQGASESGGRRVLTSNVTFDCNQIDADDFLNGMRHDVAASTAILNGARFPWISPGGTFSNRRCAAAGEVKPPIADHVLDGGYFDNAGAETLREMVRAIRSLPDDVGAPDKLAIVFVLIGYTDHDPTQPPPPPPTGFGAWASERVAALATNDVFAPLLGLYNGMGAHETHLAREMKLAGQTTVVDPDPYLSRMDGANGIAYAAVVLCPGHVEYEGAIIDRYDPPMDWSLSGEAKRYIENAVLPKSGACAADKNAEAIRDVIDKLGR